MRNWRDSQFTKYVDDLKDFDAFFDGLMSNDRKPFVVASIAEDQIHPRIDIDFVETELEDSVNLYVLSARATYWLTDKLLSNSLSVHSGWARIYPAKANWIEEHYLAPIFRPSVKNGSRVSRQIVEAALAAIFKEGYQSDISKKTTGRQTTAKVTGVVTGSTQVIVQTDLRRQAVMRTHHLFPGLTADRLAMPGQKFEGFLEGEGLLGEFIPDQIVDDVTPRVRDFIGDGVITSALVSDVKMHNIGLKLHPHFDIYVSDELKGNLSDLVTIDTVVTVEVVPIDGELVATFSDEEPSPAISIYLGGPPWIVPQQPHGEILENTAEEVHEELGSTEEKVLSQDREPFEAYELHMEELEKNLVFLRGEVERLKSELRKSARIAIPILFSDSEEQLRLEINLSYLARVDEVLRSQYPMPESYRISEGFIRKIEALVGTGGIKREKIIDVCADVLSGRAKDIPARGLKDWTDGKNGRQLVRDSDGALAWRVRLQTSTSSARRLKFWVHRDGTFELDSVGVHDDGI